MRRLHSLKSQISLLIVIAIGFASVTAQADIFVTIPGIPGESVVAGHEDQIDALAAGGSFTENRCGDFILVKELDRATPLLITSAVTGALFTSIVVEYTATVGGPMETVSTINLDGSKITSVSLKATDAPDDRPKEEIIIQASTITVEYTQYDSSGAPLTTFSETVICDKKK